MPTTETLIAILGPVYWTFGYASLSDAHRAASRAMAEGRQSVSWTDERGSAWAAWGERP